MSVTPSLGLRLGLSLSHSHSHSLSLSHSLGHILDHSLSLRLSASATGGLTLRSEGKVIKPAQAFSLTLQVEEP